MQRHALSASTSTLADLVVHEQAAATVQELAGGPVGSLSHLIPVNPGPTELAELQDRLAATRAAAKAKKADKKVKSAAPALAAAGEPVTSAAAVPDAKPAGAAKRAAEAGPAQAAAKKFRAADIAPELADKQVWNSIFLGGRGEAKETYSCRSLSSRGMGIS